MCLASLLSQPQILENVPMVGEERSGEVFQEQTQVVGFPEGGGEGSKLVSPSSVSGDVPMWEQQLSLGFKDSELQKAAAHPAEPSQSSRVKPVRGASQAVLGRSLGSRCRGKQTEKVFTRNHSHLKKGRKASKVSIIFSLRCSQRSLSAKV